MEPILLSFDKRGYEKALELIKSDLSHYNNLLKAVTINTDKIEPTKENLLALISDAKMFLFDLIVDLNSLTFNGLPISKQKAVDLVDFPQAFTNIIAACNSFNKAFSNDVHEIDTSITIERLSFDDMELTDGIFVCLPDFLESLKDEFCSYTRNEGQAKAVSCINQMHEALQGLLEVGFIKKHSLDLAKLSDLGFKFYDNELRVDYDQVRRIR